MAENTKIEWTDHTFNPWEGCQKVGPGCDHCYAETRNARFGGGQAPNWGPGAPRRRTSEANWRKPHVWNKQPYWQCPCGWRGIERDMHFQDDGFGAWIACPRCQRGAFTPTRARVFCASLADVFDNQVPPAWRAELFALIAATPDLDWLLLTKRIGNVNSMLPMRGKLPSNVWLGATITSQAEADRDIRKLLAVPARVRFLSMEPLLSGVNLTDVPGPESGHGHHEFSPIITINALKRADWQKPRVDWVIVGGESGPGARPMHPDWARSLRDQCAAAGVPFLFKQWGEWIPADQSAAARGANGFAPIKGFEHLDGHRMHRIGKKAAGRLLDGTEHNGFPGGDRA